MLETIYDTAAFLQDDIKLTKKVTLTAGYRIDNIDGRRARTRRSSQYGYYNSFFTYIPLATPVYIPAGGSSPNYTGYDNSRSINDQSFFFSLTYKPTDTSTFYLTYNHVDALLGSSNFGGVDAVYLDQVLSTKSTLYEGGYKQSFLQNKLYFAGDVFQQLKYGTQITGGKYPIKDNGLELEAVYQPSKAWNLNANFTYQEATAYGVFYQAAGNYLDTFSTATPVDGTFGTSVGSPNFTLYFPPGGRMRAPGIPQLQANAFAEYSDPSGWGIGMGPQFIGRQYANDQDTLYIPAGGRVRRLRLLRPRQLGRAHQREEHAQRAAPGPDRRQLRGQQPDLRPPADRGLHHAAPALLIRAPVGPGPAFAPGRARGFAGPPRPLRGGRRGHRVFGRIP